MTRERVLLVDGTNIVMRCAFGGHVPAERAIPIAAGMITRAVCETRAAFLIVAFDAPPSWRGKENPDYKAHRTTKTAPFVVAATEDFSARGWHCAASPEFEADDVIATIVARGKGRLEFAVLSGDSDLLALVDTRCTVLRPESGSAFSTLQADDVVAKFGVRPEQLADYKGLVGEPGDHIAGVPGIGPKTAVRLLAQHRCVNAILVAGGLGATDPDVMRVCEHRVGVWRALRLTTLRRDVPLHPIAPASCWVGREVAA